MARGGSPRVGVVGASRRRNGLGPFLIRAFEDAGADVVAICGRDVGRTAPLAADLAARVGHPVAVYVDPSRMCVEEDLDVLVIATPSQIHIDGLRAALEARVHVLCEKPLVAPEQHDQVDQLLDGFAERDFLLIENTQWPETLTGFRELHPDADLTGVRELAMRLSPSQCGRDMVTDSLSHLLSMVQALAPVDASTRVAEIAFSDRSPDAEAIILECALESPFPRLAVRFEMIRKEQQPRPAWYRIDGLRAEREIDMTDYSMRLGDGERAVSIGDPLDALVYRFLQLWERADSDTIRAETDRVRQRARLFQDVLGAFDDS